MLSIFRLQWVEYNYVKILTAVLTAICVVLYFAYKLIDHFAFRSFLRGFMTNSEDVTLFCIPQYFALFLSLLALIMNILSSSSNSFIINEEWIVYGGLQCCLLGQLVLLFDVENMTIISYRRFLQIIAMSCIARAVQFRALHTCKVRHVIKVGMLNVVIYCILDSCSSDLHYAWIVGDRQNYVKLILLNIPLTFNIGATIRKHIDDFLSIFFLFAVSHYDDQYHVVYHYSMVACLCT